MAAVSRTMRQTGRGVRGLGHVSHVTLDTLLTLVRARAGPRDVQRDQGDHCHEPHHGSRGCRAGQPTPSSAPTLQSAVVHTFTFVWEYVILCAKEINQWCW